MLQGYDIGNFTDGPAVITDFPFEVWANHDALNKSALALGPKSSVLERLVDNHLAPSAAFSIDYGSRSELYPRDGQAVFGGVNDARYDSKTKTTFPMWGYAAPVNCPLQVLLEDVILTNANGNHSLFDDPGSTVTACVDTIQNAFTWTPDMFATWQNLTNWVASDSNGVYDQQTYPMDREPLIGTLTIKLANGHTTVIPHYELLTQERGTDPQGKYAVINSSRIMAAVQAGESDLGDNIPILGGVYLSQNYLHVDYDAGEFWLSPQVGNGTFPDRITSSCVSNNSTDSGSGTNSGAGGGSKIGLAAGLPVAFVVVALGLVAYFMWRRNQNHKRNAAQTDTLETAIRKQDVSADNDVSALDRPPSELVGDSPIPRRPSEVAGKQLPAHKEDVFVFYPVVPSKISPHNKIG